MADSETSALPQYSALAKSEQVLIEIGPGRTKFYVHEELLCHYSKYFKSLLRGTFKEAKEKKVAYEDIEVETFEHFVDWIYHGGKLSFTHDVEVAGICALIRLFILADRFDIVKLRNAAIDCFDPHTLPCFEDVQFAYDHTPAGSMLRKSIVHNYACLYEPTQDDCLEKKDRDLPPKQFFLDLVLEISAIREVVEPAELDDCCDFHQHESTEAKFECERNWIKEEDKNEECPPCKKRRLQAHIC